MLGQDRYGRDALPRDPAWHVSKLVSGFSDGRSCVYRDMAFVRDVPRRIARERVPTIEESRLVTSSLYSYGWSLWIIGFAL